MDLQGVARHHREREGQGPQPQLAKGSSDLHLPRAGSPLLQSSLCFSTTQFSVLMTNLGLLLYIL